MIQTWTYCQTYGSSFPAISFTINLRNYNLLNKYRIRLKINVRHHKHGNSYEYHSESSPCDGYANCRTIYPISTLGLHFSDPRYKTGYDPSRILFNLFPPASKAGGIFAWCASRSFSSYYTDNSNYLRHYCRISGAQ